MFDRMNVKGISLLAAAALLAAVLILPASGCSEYRDSSVTAGGIKYPPETESITLSEYDSDDYSPFAGLKNLRTLDVTALDLSPDEYLNMRSQLGQNVKIIWSVPLSQGRLPSNTPEISFTGDIRESDAYKVKYFTELNRLNIADSEVSDSLYTAISSATETNPDVQINCSAKIYGVLFDNNTELLDLNNISIQSPDLLCLAIELFPNIKTIEMCDCGLSNGVMQGLRDEYPQIKFVWTIRFLNFKVRTDIQVFSTLATNYNRPGDTETFMPVFKYCTELRALDLGHMAITDISEIRNLKKLHTLILADNYITDISPIADLKELVYVELFQNRISDVSPLLELPLLEDLNLCYNPRMENPTVLTGITNLKRLYISHCSLDRNEISTLRNGIPSDCEFNYTAPNCVFSGWRTSANARNTKIREAFKNWKKVKEYPSWDNIVYTG